MNLKDEKTRRELALKYQPLLYKIANQMKLKMPQEMDFDDVIGYGNEGIAYAMNTYKENMGQSFQQYLGWCIRNKMLTGINEEGHTIKFSAYHQKKVKSGDAEYPSLRSLDSYFDSNDNDDDAPSSRMAELGTTNIDCDMKDFYIKFLKWVYTNFSKRDADIFLHFYGLDGSKPLSGKELAEKYGVSNCCISLSKKKIIDKLKHSSFKNELFNFLNE